MNFFGREDLLIDLDALWGKGSASLITCRGRRRIGKSTLMQKRGGIWEGRLPYPYFTTIAFGREKLL